MSAPTLPSGKFDYDPVNLPADLSAQEFFCDFLPPLLRELERMGVDPEIDFVFELALSEPEDCWSVIVADEKFEIVHGPSPDADVRLIQKFDHWRQSALRLNGRAVRPDRMLKVINDLDKLEIIQSLRAVIELDLLNPDGSIGHATRLHFGGAQKPEISISLKRSDYIEMAKGKLNPAVALIQRKIRIKGEWGILRKLAPLRK